MDSEKIIKERQERKDNAVEITQIPECLHKAVEVAPEIMRLLSFKRVQKKKIEEILKTISVQPGQDWANKECARVRLSGCVCEFYTDILLYRPTTSNNPDDSWFKVLKETF